jgi:hypothetical protein
MRKLCESPTLGGWLSIFNCIFWLGLTVIYRLGFDVATILGERVFVYSMFVMSLPVAWVFFLPSLGGAAVERAIALVMLGCNSFLWGYSVAALVRLVKRLTSRCT